jgi:hypothetical protein
MKRNGRLTILLSSILIGLLIMLSPIFITGYTYNTSRVMGSLLTGEFIVRTVALIIGLIIIYDGVKIFFKTE